MSETILSIAGFLTIAVTLLVLGIMISGIVKPVIAFMVGVALALLINYRYGRFHAFRLGAFRQRGL